MKKKPKPKPQIKIHAVVFTPAEVKILRRVSGVASDTVGRAISMSAVLRAMVQWVGARDGKFLRAEIVPVVEKEMALLRWGLRKEK